MPKASSKKSEKPIEEMSYEEALAELESVVESLEGGQSPLEESMKLFERGRILAGYCGSLLDSAQLRVQKLSGEYLSPFEDESE